MYYKLFIFALTLSLIFAGINEAQIKNSKHDLSFSSTATVRTTTSGYNEVCVFCHTPHSKQSSSLLWNRTASTATYTVYSSPTMEGTVPQPGGVSKNCLSCHDGTATLECGSCHNPHSVSGVSMFLRVSNANSELCLTCHIK
ncbi:MAG: cytochrome c3 family protein [Bacteroidota bacterium]|nr:cytochrome c3 family protein [Bacteroidota bacterium]